LQYIGALRKINKMAKNIFCELLFGVSGVNGEAGRATAGKIRKIDG
jgi:hypothetical protein